MNRRANVQEKARRSIQSTMKFSIPRRRVMELSLLSAVFFVATVRSSASASASPEFDKKAQTNGGSTLAAMSPMLRKIMRNQLQLLPSVGQYRSLQQQEGGGTATTIPTLRECNAEIGRITQQEILSMLGLVLNGDEMGGAMLAALTPSMKYDVSAYKLCGSCENLVDSGILGVESNIPAGKYGYDAQHSALVLVPVDPATGEFVQGSLRGAAYYHGTMIDVDGAPTETWPSSLEGLRSGDEEAAGAVIEALFSAQTPPFVASAGAVVIAPDYLGYGQSLPTHNRTYVVRYSYEQAAIVTWLTAQNWIKEATGGCTQLEDTVSISGVSEGGYAAIAASSVLSDMGVRILKVRANAPALSLEDIAVYALLQHDNGLISPDKANIAFTLFLPLAGFAYSSELPTLANTGVTDQTMLSSDWMVPDDFGRNIPAWLESPDPISGGDIYALMPSNVYDIIQTGMVDLVREAIAANINQPCSLDSRVEKGVDMLCQALIDNDLKQVVATIAYPTELCYSVNDSVIPPFQFTDEMFQNSFVTSVKGFDGAPLTNGDHVQASIDCIFAGLASTLGAGFMPGSDPDELPFLVSSLSADGCAAISTTTPSPRQTDAEPTLAPVVDIGTAPPSDMPVTDESPPPSSAILFAHSYAVLAFGSLLASLMLT